MMFLYIGFEVVLKRVTSHSYAAIMKPCHSCSLEFLQTVSADMVQELPGHAVYMLS